HRRPLYMLIIIGHRQGLGQHTANSPPRSRYGPVLNLPLQPFSGAVPPNARVITVALWSSMPMYVPSYVPRVPIASENKVPPIVTRHPLLAAPSMTALRFDSETLLSTKMACILCSTR